MAMDYRDMVTLYDSVNFKKLKEAAERDDQALLLAEFEATGSSNRPIIKRAPQIVEGDIVNCRLSLRNPRETRFPGGELLVVVLYSNNQHQGPPKIPIPGLAGKEKITIDIGKHDALSAGIAKVFLYGRTARQQIILFASQSEATDNSPVVLPPFRSVYRFKVWPLSAVYSTVAILLATFSLAVSTLAVLYSIWSR